MSFVARLRWKLTPKIVILILVATINIISIAHRSVRSPSFININMTEPKDIQINNIEAKLQKAFHLSNLKKLIQKQKALKREELLEPRQYSCDACFKHDFKYIFKNEQVCETYENNQTIDILFLIFVASYDNERRTALRYSWLSASRNNTSNIRYVFLIGRAVPNTKGLDMRENQIFRDIVQEDFTENYFNITYKLVEGLKWATQYCHNARFVCKTDGDIFINIPPLLKLLNREHTFFQKGLGGSCGKEMHPSREGLYAISRNEYPQDVYPPYCSGGGYVTSMGVVKDAYEMSKNVPFFKFEDVYMGMLLERFGYQVKTFPGFNFQPQTMNPCAFKDDFHITVHNLEPENIFYIWNYPCQQT